MKVKVKKGLSQVLYTIGVGPNRCKRMTFDISYDKQPHAI